MTIQEIRQDLRDIRYYYSKKEQFDRASNIILPKALSSAKYPIPDHF